MPAQKTEFKPIEVAYREPGKAWKRKVAKTETAFSKLIEKLLDAGDVEILTREAE